MMMKRSTNVINIYLHNFCRQYLCKNRCSWCCWRSRWLRSRDVNLSLWLAITECMWLTVYQGCSEKVDRFKKVVYPWSAAHSIDYSYTRMTVHNATHLYMEQVSDDQVGLSNDPFWNSSGVCVYMLLDSYSHDKSVFYLACQDFEILAFYGVFTLAMRGFWCYKTSICLSFHLSRYGIMSKRLKLS